MGVADTIAGWRNSDNKAVNIGLGDGLHITSGVLSSRDSQYLDVINITDDTLNISIVRDGVTTHRLDLKPYLDSDPENTDIQYFDTLYFAMDTLYLSIIRDDLPVHKIYLGDLVSIADQDKQQHDTAFILDDTLYLSLQRDSVNAHEIDLTPYLDDTDDQYLDTATIVSNVLRLSIHDDNLPFSAIDLSPYVAQTYAHTGTTSYTNSLSLGGGTFTLSPLAGIAIVHNGSGIVTFQNTGIVTFDINSVDDAYSATTIQSGNTIHFDGIGGIVTSLAAPGSTTVRIDGTALIDHDWYEVGTTSPPNAITDGMFHTGKTGIGMNPVYLLDVAEDARIYGHQIGRGSGNIQSNTRFGISTISGDNSGGANNTAIGAYSMSGLDEGSQNTALGSYAMNAVTNGSYNLAIGYEALMSTTSSTYNLAIGNQALKNNNSGTLNVAIGVSTLQNCISCYDNTVIGHNSLLASTSGSYNTVVGHSNMSANSTGSSNTTVGDYVLVEDTSANQNVFIGRFAGLSVKNTLGNVVMGYYAMNSTSNGNQYNTAIGFESMYGNFGSANTYNIGIGYRTLYNINGSGDENIAIGKNTGANLAGSNNTILGNDNTVTGNVDNNVIIGDGQTVTSAGNIVITNGAGTLGIKMLSTGLVGIGEATPTQKLHVAGSARITGAFYDSNNDPGTSGQVLSSTVTGTDWITGGGGGATDLTITGSGPYTINSSTGTDITITQGSGISMVRTGNDLSISAPTPSMSLNRGAGSGVYPSSGSGVGFIGSGITISAYGGNSTDIQFVATDPSLSNEGSLSVGAGAASTSLINSNTSGSTAVTLSAGTGVTLSESGNTITISAPAVGTVTSVAMTVPTGIGVTGSPITTSGTFALTLNNDLAAVENLATTGLVVRTGASTWTTRTLTSAGGINVSFGDGSGGNPTVSLQPITGLATGFTNNTIVITDGSGTFGEGSFTSLATGFTAGYVMYVGADGTPETEAAFSYTAAANLLNVGTLQTGTLAFTGGTGGTMQLSGLSTFASEAAAGSLSSGTIYKTATGELRIKL